MTPTENALTLRNKDLLKLIAYIKDCLDKGKVSEAKKTCEEVGKELKSY